MTANALNITVLISPVHDCLNPVAIEPGGCRIDPFSIRWIVNPYDGIALEQALRLKNKLPGTRIRVVGISPFSAERVFRECLAAGAEEAVRIWDEELQEMDSYAHASVLATFLHRHPFDLLLSGVKSADLEIGQLRPMLGNLLALPQITAAREVLLERDGAHVSVMKRMPGHTAKYTCPLPAMVTMEKGQPLRYPRFPDRRRANNIPIPVLNAKALGIPEANLGRSACLTFIERYTPPKPVKRSALAAAGSIMSTAARLNQVISGGLQDQKQTRIWECKDACALGRIIQHMLTEKMVML